MFGITADVEPNVMVFDLQKNGIDFPEEVQIRSVRLNIGFLFYLSIVIQSCEEQRNPYFSAALFCCKQNPIHQKALLLVNNWEIMIEGTVVCEHQETRSP